MPRSPRLFLPNIPLHIVQRGHDRQPTFIQRRDFEYYIANLADAKSDHDIRMYGYCLMTNHVHLLIAPGDDVTGVSRFMRILAGRQTRYINKRKSRTGTLWEGRFKASLVDTDAYLLACYRYIDLNPIRSALARTPDEYKWSSYRNHAGLAENSLLDVSDTYRALGTDRATRASAYQRFVASGIDDEEISAIRTASRRNQVTGNHAFKEAIERRTGRLISSRGRGRPLKIRK
jgi:putative transposase